MALFCEELAATLLTLETPNECLAQALFMSLPGLSCLRCSRHQVNDWAPCLDENHTHLLCTLTFDHEYLWYTPCIAAACNSAPQQKLDIYALSMTRCQHRQYTLQQVTCACMKPHLVTSDSHCLVMSSVCTYTALQLSDCRVVSIEHKSPPVAAWRWWETAGRRCRSCR